MGICFGDIIVVIDGVCLESVLKMLDMIVEIEFGIEFEIEFSCDGCLIIFMVMVVEFCVG